jgi:hypothetical protein
VIYGWSDSESLKPGSARIRYVVRPVSLLGSSDELWVDPRPHLLFLEPLGRNHDPAYMKEMCLVGNLGLAERPVS